MIYTKPQRNNPTNKTQYAIDKFWFGLQGIHNWYLITPLTVVQREDYSDIEKIKNDFGITDLVIIVNKRDLQSIFTNIFENAIRHSGFGESSQISKIKIPRRFLMAFTLTLCLQPSQPAQI